MIELSNIEKRFGDAVILKDISIRIPEGSVTALVGPSGGGKSTLLRCINLLEIPTVGTIRLGEETLSFTPGKRVGWQAIQKIRRQTGMVFQNFQLFPHQTAIENVMEGLVTVLKWPREKARERASGAADQGRHGAQDRCLALDALRRPAAARGDRPRSCAFAARIALRRADVCA